MQLSENIIENIKKAHFVSGIEPTEYLVKYRSIFELLQYRAHLYPDDLYITFYNDDDEKISLTYGEFSKAAYRTANLLKAKGIKQGDRIATISHNHINTVIQYFGAWCSGVTVVPINVNEEPDRIKYILKNSHSRLAFINEKYSAKFADVLNELGAIPVTHGSPNAEFETGLEKYGNEFEPDDSINPETEALIVYTSGTTGLPKGVVLTQYNLMVDADGISKWHKIDRGCVMMCVLPIHHVNGTIVTIMTPMYAGGKLVLNQKFHTDKFFQRLADENVNIVSVVPTLLQFLCHDFEGKTNNIPKSYKFSHIICGAGPLTCELVSKFEEMFRLKIVHGYGLSETTCYSCFIPVDLSDSDHRKWLNDYGFPAIGIAIEPNEMDIHNDKGESMPENSRGEIVIRGHNVMKYYDENAEANDKTFEFGWFRSGDEGFYINNETGRKYFFITGRIKELIIRGGINIAPLEIDEVIMSVPEVKAGIAVGFDNDWYGEEVGALVLLKDGFEQSDETKDKIIKVCREKLPYYKTPKTVIFSETIPVTSTGKYQRNKVKYLFSDFKTVQFRE